MKQKYFDNFEFKATRDPDTNFLVDIPIVGRTGVQLYGNGRTVRREYRPADEVFAPESLASFNGKPITIDHPDEFVTSSTRIPIVGMITGEAFRDGDAVRVKVTVSNEDAIRLIESRSMCELSLGYTVDHEEPEDGMCEGIMCDFVQRNIRINHLAIVEHGRAGVARFNVDSEDSTFMSIKDNQINQETKQDAAEVVDKAAFDALCAERDALKAEIEGIKAAHEEAINGIEARIRADIAERNAIEQVADSLGTSKQGTVIDVMKGVIAKQSPTISLADKSDDYIRAAFDIVTKTESVNVQSQPTVEFSYRQ